MPHLRYWRHRYQHRRTSLGPLSILERHITHVHANGYASNRNGIGGRACCDRLPQQIGYLRTLCSFLTLSIGHKNDEILREDIGRLVSNKQLGEV